MSDPIQQARAELLGAWEKVKDETEGLAFGEVCCKWSDELGESLYPLWKELGIAPTVADWWMGRYKRSKGLKDLHKEKRPNRRSNTFDEVQQTALRLISSGFKTLSAQEPNNQRLFQAGKDWAQARLSRTDL
jgi:hypothetical protein